MDEYYTKEDFNSIIIGESTHRDVFNIAHIELLYITSYGGLCEFPTENGGYICIKFYGKDLIVGSIEYATSSIKE